MLRTASGRRAKIQGPRPVVIYVVAAGCGHLGGIVFTECREYPLSPPTTTTAAWRESGGADIYDFDMAVSMFGMSLAADILPGRPEILGCGHRAATKTTVRGHERPEQAAHCALILAISALFSAPARIESAAGTLSPIDPPFQGLPSL